MSPLLPTLGLVLSLLHEGPADARAVVRANNQLALDLYARFQTEWENLFFSPYSISKTLAMTYAGARGQTAREMEATLHFDLGQERQHRAFLELRKLLNQPSPNRYTFGRPMPQKPGDDQLYISANLWGQQGHGFRKEFLALVDECYGAGIQETDFSNPEQAREMINAWVEGQTNRKIKDLLSPGSLDARTRLVLASAMYFKGRWASPFEKHGTTPAPFRRAGKAPLSVPMMKQMDSFGYFEDQQMQVLSMPYDGEKRALLVLLPREVDGLAKLEKTLTADRLAGLAAIHSERVEVHLPRFRMMDQFSLKEALQALGMRLAFNETAADFTAMSGGPERLFISAVTHKAFIDVDEKGTEAAAATAVVGTAASATPMMAPAPPPVFRADHPFLFAICDVQTGLILFLGRVMKP